MTIECAICDGHYSYHREHCPFCGARRTFIASHSYEPYRVVVKARNSQQPSLEMVRAFSATFCSDERAVLQSRASFDE